MILTLALWVVGLQQTYWEQGGVPLVHLYLVFWSVLLVKAMALPVGVLVGYRRS
jgi:ABC-type proline/glycine betaine transport system permease subunit